MKINMKELTYSRQNCGVSTVYYSYSRWFWTEISTRDYPVSYKSFVAVIACLNLWSVLRIMDLQSGITFKMWWSKTNENNKGTYIACRLIAYALVVCFIFAFT